MGSYVFKWDHPAEEVYVTGTFDDWGKTVKLDKKDGYFVKDVELPSATDKVYYKFVVNDNWTTDHTAPQETDEHNNTNNILLPENIKKSNKADSQSYDDEGSSALPGAFPETPGFENPSFGIAPIPATSGTGNPVQSQAGDGVPHHSQYTDNKLDSGVTLDKESYERAGGAEEAPADLPGDKTPSGEAQQFSVNPLPATAGTGNPVQSRPGEGMPHSSEYTTNDINSAVTLDKESYDRAGGAGGAPQLPDVVTPATERGTGLFGLPEQSSSMIPESSLPIIGGVGAGAAGAAMLNSTGPTSSTAQLAGQVPNEPSARDPTIQSAHPSSTTAALAGEVPLEPSGVPEVVQQSQEKAGFSPEASANPEAVQEKAAMEKELEKKVPEEPAVESNGNATGTSASTLTEKAKETIGGGPSETSTGTTTEKAKGAAMGAAAGVAAAGAAGAAYLYQKSPESVQKNVPPSVLDSINQMNSQTGGDVASGVPEPVKESISQAHSSPEAASSSTAVGEKSAMEAELLKKVPTENATGEHAPSATSAAATSSSITDATPIASAVPDSVQESIAAAHISPEAATSSEAVREKSAVEAELLKKVPTENATGEHAPSATGLGASSAAATSSSSGPTAIASAVPDTVQESIATSHVFPEAVTSSEAVREKSAVESELQSKIPLATQGGEPAPTASAALSETAPGSNSKSTEAPLSAPTTTAPTTSTTSGLAAPASAPAKPKTSALAEALDSKPRQESRDISPMSRPAGQKESSTPVVTSGVASGTTATTSTPTKPSAATSAAAAAVANSTPTKSSPAPVTSSPAASQADSKASKRKSGFFGKLKSKFGHKSSESQS